MEAAAPSMCMSQPARAKMEARWFLMGKLVRTGPLEGVAEKRCLCHVGAHVCPPRDVGTSIQGKWSACSLIARHPG